MILAFFFCLKNTCLFYLVNEYTADIKSTPTSDIQAQEQVPAPQEARFGERFHEMNDYGKYVSVALNNNSIVVEVCEECSYPLNSLLQSKRWREPSLMFRFGQLKGNSISWEDRQRYGKGYRPHVAINNNNIIALVHENNRECYYRVGKVNIEEKIITWGSDHMFTQNISTLYGKVYHPGVAITDDNDVILTCCVDESNSKAFYIVGTFNTDILKLDFYSEHSRIITPNVTKKLSIAANSSGVVVIAYQVDKDHMYCMTGRLNGREIEWDKNQQPLSGCSESTDYPAYPVVSINSHGYFVVVHHNIKGGIFKWSSNMTFDVGYASHNHDEFKIYPECYLHYGEGWNPAIAIDDKNRMVEVHESSDLLHTCTYYHIGSFRIEK